MEALQRVQDPAHGPRIHVYPPIEFDHPYKDVQCYPGLEQVIPEQLKKLPNYEPDPAKADVFVIAHNATCYAMSLLAKNPAADIGVGTTAYEQYLRPLLLKVREQANLFGKGSGHGAVRPMSAHAIVFDWGYGLCLFPEEMEEMLGLATVISAYGARDTNHAKVLWDRTRTRSCNRPGHDIVVPPITGSLSARLSSPVAKWAERKVMLYYRGRIMMDPQRLHYSQAVGQVLWARWYDAPAEGNLVVSINDGAHPQGTEAYYKELNEAKYCVVASMWETYNPSLYECMANGAVPVLMVDGIILPFERLIDWRSAIIKLFAGNAVNAHVVLGEAEERGGFAYKQRQRTMRELLPLLMWDQQPSTGPAAMLVLELACRHKPRAFSAACRPGRSYEPVAFDAWL